MIKEYCRFVCSIREDNYSQNLAKIHRLFAEAVKDYPHLKDHDVSVVYYGGDTVKGQMGIEFDLTGHGVAILPDYIELGELREVLA
jgi:hypothetical protein